MSYNLENDSKMLDIGSTFVKTNNGGRPNIVIMHMTKFSYSLV